MIRALAQRLADIVGAGNVLGDELGRTLYEYDGGVDRARPDLVVFPTSREQVIAVVQATAAAGAAVIARGAGTGLSGGAIAREGGVVVALNRMRRVLELDLENARAVVEPGVVNLEFSQAIAATGFYFAPDPSSQRACTLGGNVAENSGGPHTLAHGVTVNHVSGLEVVLGDGRCVELGGRAAEAPGWDLTGLMVGSEGTLALVTAITLKLTRLPETVATLLAIYDQVEAAAETVSALTAAGITPAACEMMDGFCLRAIEAATGAGYPLDSEAVLLIDVEGLAEEVAEEAAAVEAIARRAGARQVRRAADAGQRELLWSGRKNAFGAMGRISPNNYV
ncbi:MAG: FAD-binding oxidoreductase, partial [Terriglobales bacterium]